jgi:hypothetical protein
MESEYNLYHKILNLRYKKTKYGLQFEDGVFYSIDEIEILKNDPGFDHLTIHSAKKVFDGELVNERL